MVTRKSIVPGVPDSVIGLEGITVSVRLALDSGCPPPQMPGRPLPPATQESLAFVDNEIVVVTLV